MALKQVHTRLQVGGPATSGTAWLPEFFGFCRANNAPVDFVSTHACAGDRQEDIFGPGAKFATSEVVPEAVRQTSPRFESGETSDLVTSAIHKAMRSHAPTTAAEQIALRFALGSVATSQARYVWLPIRFDGDRPVVEWRSEWSLDDFS